MQAHNNEGVPYVTGLQLVRALQYTSDKEFLALIEAVSNGNGDTHDPQILDKALFLTVSRYKSSLSHDSMWVTAAESLISKGAKIDHAKMEEIWKEFTADFHDVSFDNGYKKMEAVLKQAKQLDSPLTYAKPPRPAPKKEIPRQSQPSQDSKFRDVEEVYSTSGLAPEVNINELATLLRGQLRKFIKQEKAAEGGKEHQRNIVRSDKDREKALSAVKPKKVKKPSHVSSWSSAISQLVHGKEEKIDEQEREFRVEHKQQKDSLKKVVELLSKLDSNSDPERVLQEFCKYLSDNQRRNESNDFDERLLQRLNSQRGWRTAFAIEQNSSDALRNSVITKIVTFFKEKQERVNVEQQREKQMAEEDYRKSLEEGGDVLKILEVALYSAKNNYEAEYKNFSWVSYYFNHALTGTTAAEARKLCSDFSKLKCASDNYLRNDDVEFKKSQEKLMMQLLSDYLNVQGGLLSQHKDPLDEHAFGTFLLKKCYESPVLRRHFGWDDLAPNVSYGVLAAAEKFLQNYAPAFAVTVFHSLVGDYSGENMVNSRGGRELMRNKMIEKLKTDVGQDIGVSPAAPAKQA